MGKYQFKAEDKKYDYSKDYQEEDFEPMEEMANEEIEEVPNEPVEEVEEVEEVKKEPINEEIFKGINSLEEAEKEFWFKDNKQDAVSLHRWYNYFYSQFSREEAMEKIENKEWSEHTAYGYRTYVGCDGNVPDNYSLVTFDPVDLDEWFDLGYFIEEVWKDQYEDQLRDYEKELNDKINSLNENSSVKDLIIVYESIDLYSDLYKDVNHIRPSLAPFFEEANKRAPKAAQEYTLLSREERNALFNDSKSVKDALSIKEQIENAIRNWLKSAGYEESDMDYFVVEEMPYENEGSKCTHIQIRNDLVGYYEVEAESLTEELDKIVSPNYFEPYDATTWDCYLWDKVSAKDSKQVNNSIIDFINQLEISLKGANSIAAQLAKQIPTQQPTTNEEKSLYNGKYLSTFEAITSNVKNWFKSLEEFKKELSTAHIVENEILEEFPLKARNALRESENKEQTYKELVEDLKQRYYSMKNKEKYKDDVIKMKKDLDAFYKETFKK